MLRGAVGVLNPLLEGGAAARKAAGDVVAKNRTWRTRKLSTKIPATRTSSLLWSQRIANIKGVSTKRAGSFRAPLPPVKRPFHSTRARRAAAAEPTSLGARFKKLSREYGWAAVGVYMGLSVLDFPFCFLLVRTVGTEKIGTEHFSFAWL